MNVFVLFIYERANNKLQTNKSLNQHAWPDRTTPLQSVWSMALSTKMIECEPFICLFIFIYMSVASVVVVMDQGDEDRGDFFANCLQAHSGNTTTLLSSTP